MDTCTAATGSRLASSSSAYQGDVDIELQCARKELAKERGQQRDSESAMHKLKVIGRARFHDCFLGTTVYDLVRAMRLTLNGFVGRWP